MKAPRYESLLSAFWPFFFLGLTHAEICGVNEYVGLADGQLTCQPCLPGATYQCGGPGEKNCHDTNDGVSTCELPSTSVKIMDSGYCEWGWEPFTYKKDCEYGTVIAEGGTGFSDTLAKVVDQTNEDAKYLPDGCFYKVSTGDLYYNENGDPNNALASRRVVCRLRKDLVIANAPDTVKYVKKPLSTDYADIHTHVTDIYECNPLFNYYKIDPDFDETTMLVADDADNLQPPAEFCVSETVIGLLEDYIYCILYLSGMSIADVQNYVDHIRAGIATTLEVETTQVIGIIYSTQVDGSVKLEFKVSISSSEQAKEVKKKEQDPYLNQYMQTYLSQELSQVGVSFSLLNANLNIHLIYQRSGVNPAFDRKRPDQFDVGDTVWVDFLYSGYFYPAEIQRKASAAQLGEYSVRFYAQNGEFSDYQETMDHVTAEYVIDLPYFSTGEQVWALDSHTYTWRAATVTFGNEKVGYREAAATVEYNEDLELRNPAVTLTDVQAPDDVRKWDFHEIRPLTQYHIFDRVWLEYKGEIKWHKGVITEVTGEGAHARYTVYTDNGLVDKNVIGAYLHLINKARVLDSKGIIGNPWMTEADFRSLVYEAHSCCMS